MTQQRVVRDVVPSSAGIVLTERSWSMRVERRAAFIIRRAAPTDREAWLALRATLWPATPAHEHVTEVDRWYFDPEGSVCLVCEERSGGLVGFVEVSLRTYAEGCRSTPVGYVEGWYVAPAVRRRGVGRALMAAGERWARMHGCREYASDTEVHNVESQRALAALGFEEAKRIVCFRRTVRSEG
jgi:aminoglycoside 6'-N-acetyltransferase I